MRVTDIMIGDWVLAKPSMLPIQVAAVHKNKVGYHAVTHKLNWVRIGLLDPAPLTAEILEKNFRADKQWGENGWYINDHIHIYQATPGVYNIQYMEIVDIRYVHELQHALKLCGIDKNIEL